MSNPYGLTDEQMQAYAAQSAEERAVRSAQREERGMSEAEVIEALADKEHAGWSRWQRQVATSYNDLSEQEKQSDRNEVMRIMPIIRDYKGLLSPEPAAAPQPLENEQEQLARSEYCNPIFWQGGKSWSSDQETR